MAESSLREEANPLELWLVPGVAAAKPLTSDVVPPLADLFTPAVPESDLHPYFARIISRGSEAERDVIRDWARGFVDRDGKFVKEFQTTFNSSFWELYLHASLRRMGFEVDLSHARPDFLVDGPPGRLALEAVVALNPQELAPDWAEHGPPTEIVDRERLLDLATLRLAQSVQAKSDKWLRSYASLSQCAERAFVICVAPFEQPHAQLQGTQGIARVLFGEPQELSLNENSRSVAVGGVNLQETFKPSGARVGLGLFRDERLGHVSGVLFSSLATWSKVNALAVDDGRPFVFHAVRMRAGGALEHEAAQKAEYVESLLDGLHLFANPFAQRPLATKPWRDAGVGVHRLLGETMTPDSDVPDGVLVSRTSVRFSFGGAPLHPAGAPKAKDFPLHQPARPRDGEWFAGPAVLGTTDDVFLALHDGWTICVGRDRFDDDWQYIVKRGAHLSMQQFIDAGDPGSKKAAIAVSFKTRDGALQDARQWIATKGARNWKSPSKRRKRRP